jgi:uncharacterized repeat protein (TIGR01451 family)
MKSVRTFFLSWLIIPLTFLTGIPAAGINPVFGQCDSCCPLVVPLVPLMPGSVGCGELSLADICRPKVTPPAVPSNLVPSDPPTPVVKIKVRVPAVSAPGEPIEYRIRVENESAADAHDVVVKNAIPANARFLRASPEPHVKEGELAWRFGTMKGGGCHEILLVLQPTNNEDLRNCARVSFEHGQCVTTRLANGGEIPSRPPQIVPETTPKDKVGQLDPEEAHKLALEIVGPKKQYLNVSTRYNVTIFNKGKIAATNLLVDFTLADKTVFERASDGGVQFQGTVAWKLGTLEPGTSRTVEVYLKSPIIAELCHKATALADKRAKAQAEFCTNFAGVSALLLELSGKENPIAVGGTTSYPIRVTNTGSAPVTNLRLLAVIPESVTLTRAKASVNHNLGNPQAGKNVLVFEPLPTLAPGGTTDYVIFVQGARDAKDARFHIEMRADQLENGPVIQEESTRVYPEESSPIATPAPAGQTPGPGEPPLIGAGLTLP